MKTVSILADGAVPVNSGASDGTEATSAAQSLAGDHRKLGLTSDWSFISDGMKSPGWRVWLVGLHHEDGDTSWQSPGRCQSTSPQRPHYYYMAGPRVINGKNFALLQESIEDIALRS